MSRTLKAIAAAAGLALASGAALGDDRYEGDGDYDFAPVVNVEPLRHQVRVSEPVRECWQEASYASDRPFSSNHVGATLLGSAIGIALGNQVGHGRGKDVARVAGAARPALDRGQGGKPLISRHVVGARSVQDAFICPSVDWPQCH